MKQRMKPAPRPRLTGAESREEFVEAAVAQLGGEAEAAERLGVTRAVFWHWARVSLSVEGAVVLAEALNLPIPVALRWATRRLPPPVPAREARAP